MTPTDHDATVQERIDGYWDRRARIYDEAQHRGGRDAVDRDLWGRVWSAALPPPPAHVLDLGTGSGHAAFVLAGLGHRVTMLERSPVIHALLEDGLARAAEDETTAPVVARMTLIHADSISWLQERAGQQPVADVIHLDPMFPHRDKSAAVKKEMQLFRPIVGDDPDAANLLAAALDCARYRVVVKRSRRAPAIPGPTPALKLDGKSSRYDVYPLRALPSD